MIALQNISPKIDGCAGMIVKQSHRQYDRLPAAERRWQDPEDLMQEGLIAAVQAERNYRDNEGAKYSTFFYKKLNWRLDTRIAQPVRQMKRQAVAVIELDAPNDDGIKIEVKTSDVDVEHLEQQFHQLCRALSDKAILLLVSGLICGTWEGVGRRAPEELELMLGIRGVCKAFDCSMEDLRKVSKNSTVQKRVLTWLSNTTMTGIGHEIDARILECVRCHGKLCLSAIPLGRYFIDSMTCKSCLEKMKALPAEDSCFGKPKIFAKTGAVKSEGYAQEDVECRLHCVDRNQCTQFVKNSLIIESDPVYTGKALEDSSSKGLKRMPKNSQIEDEDYEEEYVDVSDEYGDDSEEDSIKKVKKNKTKTQVAAKSEEAPKKKKKVAKPVSEEPEEAEVEEKAPVKKKKKTVAEVVDKENGPDLPFKEGSCRRALIVKAMEGATEEDLKHIATSAPFGCLNWPAMRRSILQGHSGKPPVMPVTHTWKVDQEDGVIYVRDVKKVASKKSANA